MGDFFSGAAESSADLELGVARTDKKRPSTGNLDHAEGPVAKKAKVEARATYVEAGFLFSDIIRPMPQFLA